MPHPHIRSYPAVVKIDDVSLRARTVTARINTGHVDRYETVIMPGGVDLRSFQRNPCVLWEHGQDPNRGRMPVAACRSIKFRKAEDDLLGVSEFTTDAFSQQLLDFYADGTLNGFSLEFLPDMASASRPTTEELRSRPDWATAQTIYRRCELTGYSAVAIPGNAQALALAVTRGLWVPEDVRSTLPLVPVQSEATGEATDLSGRSLDAERDYRDRLDKLIGQLYPLLMARQERIIRDTIDLERGRV